MVQTCTFKTKDYKQHIFKTCNRQYIIGMKICTAGGGGGAITSSMDWIVIFLLQQKDIKINDMRDFELARDKK